MENMSTTRVSSTTPGRWFLVCALDCSMSKHVPHAPQVDPEGRPVAIALDTVSMLFILCVSCIALMGYTERA